MKKNEMQIWRISKYTQLYIRVNTFCSNNNPNSKHITPYNVLLTIYSYVYIIKLMYTIQAVYICLMFTAAYK